jgi:TPR repeat protein
VCPEITPRRLAADGGSVDAQNNLGVMYMNGLGVKQDYVKAYKWLALGAEHSEGADREASLVALATLAGTMTPAQISDAQQRVRAWTDVFGLTAKQARPF